MSSSPSAPSVRSGTPDHVDGRRITVERLAAVQRAMRPDRSGDETDVLLETVLVTLAAGPRDLEQLTRHVCEVWPGAGLEARKIKKAVQTGREVGLIADSSTPDGDKLVATESSEATREFSDRADRALDRARAQLSDKVRDELQRQVHEEEAEQLLGVVVKAVSAGIRQAFAVYDGKVQKLSNRALLPEQYDIEAIDEVIDRAPVADELHPVLRALSLSALDASSAFGTELVTQLATGYVLHAFIARRDQLDQVEAVGTVVGEWAVLDTPVLLTLLGDTSAAHAVMATIEAGLDIRMTVGVPKRCFQELDRVLSGVANSPELAELRADLREDVDPEVLRQLTNDDVLVAWLSHQNTDGTLMSWDAFRKHARNLRERLGKIGVATLENYDRPDDRDRAKKCVSAIRSEVARHKRAVQHDHTRHDAAIREDGQTMAIVLRQREGRSHGSRFWPGAWIITPDRRLGPAYSSLMPDDPFPLTLTVAQWAELLSTFVRPASGRDLAESAAKILTHDTLMRVAARYPPDVAAQFARALKGMGGDPEIDIRSAQRTSLHELLAGDEHDDQRGKRASAKLLASRTQRREAIAAMEVERAKDEKRKAEKERERAKRQAELERTRATAAEEKLKEKSEEKEQADEVHQNELQSAQSRIAAAKRDARTATRRIALVAVSAVLLAAGVWLAIGTSFSAAGVGTVLASLLLAGKGWGLVEQNEIPVGKMVATLAPELLSLLDFLGINPLG